MKILKVKKPEILSFMQSSLNIRNVINRSINNNDIIYVYQEGHEKLSSSLNKQTIIMGGLWDP